MWDQLEISSKCGKDAIPADRLIWPKFQSIVSANVLVTPERAQAIGFPLAYLISSAQMQLIARRTQLVAPASIHGCQLGGCIARVGLKPMLLAMLSQTGAEPKGDIVPYKQIARQMAVKLSKLCSHHKVSEEDVVAWTQAGTEQESAFLRELFDVATAKIF